jgi:REP element-mobilizing transposase RayT
MDNIAILLRFKGVLCHDYWQAYYRYSCSHVLCNRHLLSDICENFAATLSEFEGEGDHVHWLIYYPPKVSNFAVNSRPMRSRR